MKNINIKKAGLILGLVLSPGISRAVQIVKTDNLTLDLGARFQLLGTLEYAANPAYVAANPVSSTTGNGNRDTSRIFLFQKQNRLKLDGNLDGTIFKFENAMGGESYPGTNNLYNLMEMSAEIPLNGNLSVVAGLAKMPWSQASATYEEDMLFTDRSELFNLFFNAGSDTTVYAKSKFGLFDATLGVEQGAANLPQRYLPETLVLPVPMFVRLGIGNMNEDAARFRQMNFGKVDELQWALHANGFWAADSNAGHSTLFGQMATQAEATKGPFYNGNMLFSKLFNPLAGFTTGPGSLARPDNQFWNASVDTQIRLPLGDSALVAGAQWSVSQYVAKGMYQTKVTGTSYGNQPKIRGNLYNFGQITVQGGEAYVAYVGSKWDVATRVDVLLPDPLIGTTAVSFFDSDPIWEITFPAITYKVNSYTKVVAETEFTYNAPEAIDVNGLYQLKTVPIEAALATQTSPMQHEWLTSKARLMLQVAF